jgi:hypothetical protein
VKPSRSIPPELTAVARRARQDAFDSDPITILAQEANRAEIENLGNEEWITRYTYESGKFGSKCFFCALVPRNQVAKVMTHDSWDLMIGNGLPGFAQSYASGRTKTTYHRFGSSPIEPFVFRQSFHGLKPDQFDLLEEFRHFHNLYHDRRNDRYIYLDDRGEEDVAVKVIGKSVRAKLRYIRQFMAARRLYLAIYFDHHIRMPPDTAVDGRTLSNETVIRADWRFSFNIGDISGDTISRLTGKKLIAPLPLAKSGIMTERQQFSEYIIGTDGNGQNVLYTCDEEALANYFGKNPEAPHFLTPVWFRREVLRKYYDHPEKYLVEDGYLRCGGLWGLRMDNDLPNHVVVYLGDLGKLAYEEQLYWKSFNIAPAADQTSDAHFRRSFLAEFSDPTSPDLVLKQKLVNLQEGWENRFGWQLFRPLHGDDSHVLKQLRIPLTDSIGEFEHQSLLLVKLLIDSLNDARLAQELGGAQPDEKSIGKLDRFLQKKGYPQRDRDVKLVRLLQAVRSTAAAHGKGKQFEKISKELGISLRPKYFVDYLHERTRCLPVSKRSSYRRALPNSISASHATWRRLTATCRSGPDVFTVDAYPHSVTIGADKRATLHKHASGHSVSKLP